MNPEKTPDEKPERTAKERSLRFSRPPYTVFIVDGPEPTFSLPGNLLKLLGRGLAPSAIEIRGKLMHLRHELRWSRETLGVILGVSRDVVRRWESGQRNPSGAARRLIWLLHALFFHRGTIPTAMDLVIWGYGKELAGFPEELARIVREAALDRGVEPVAKI